MKLADYHISQEWGFLLQNPLEELPEYFGEWNRLGKSVQELLTSKTLRKHVDQLVVLDHTRLSGHRQQRLAHVILTFLAHGYVWQEGVKDVPKYIPKQVAVPLCGVSDMLGVPPVLCLLDQLANYKLIDRSRPFIPENMKLICDLPAETKYEWLSNVEVSGEKLFAPGIQASVDAVQAANVGDASALLAALKIMLAVMKTFTTHIARTRERVGKDDFLKMIDYLVGWGPASPIESMLYEGVSELPKSYMTSSAGQSSTIQTYQTALGIELDQDGKQYSLEKRNYMMPDHKRFLDDLETTSKVKAFVERSRNKELLQLYNDNITAVKDFRSQHVQLVVSYIVVPSKNPERAETEEIWQRDTEGLVKTMKDIRNSTGDNVLPTA